MLEYEVGHNHLFFSKEIPVSNIFQNPINFTDRETEILSAYEVAVSTINSTNFDQPNPAEQAAWEALLSYYFDGEVAVKYFNTFVFSAE